MDAGSWLALGYVSYIVGSLIWIYRKHEYRRVKQTIYGKTRNYKVLVKK